jgi:hypothetical protein
MFAASYFMDGDAIQWRTLTLDTPPLPGPAHTHQPLAAAQLLCTYLTEFGVGGGGLQECLQHPLYC